MSKIFLQNSFKEFCEINKFEVNSQQVKIINSLEKFLNNRETILSRLIKKKKTIAIAGGIHKASAIKAILLNGCLYGLITDEEAAKHILND